MSGLSKVLVVGAVAAALAVGVSDLYAGSTARVTLTARPTKLGPTQNALLFGRVDNGRAGESVTLQAKACGLSSFRNVGVIETRAGGTWTQEFGPGVNTTLRAVWKGARSAPIALQQAPLLRLVRKSAREFEIGVGSQGHMWRKQVTIQRRAGRAWTAVKGVLLTDTAYAPGLGSGTCTEAEFRASVPRGSALRAVLPLSQARPCYLAGVSNTVRT